MPGALRTTARAFFFCLVSDETPDASHSVGASHLSLVTLELRAKAAIRSFSSRRFRSIATRRVFAANKLVSDRDDLRGREGWSVGHAVWLLVAPTTSCTLIRCGVRCWR